MARTRKLPRLPKWVMIGGQKWIVELADAHPEETNTFGETDIPTFTITIYELPHKKFPKNDILATLFHECLHAALRSTGLNAVCGAAEEALVSGLESSMWPLIKAGAFS